MAVADTDYNATYALTDVVNNSKGMSTAIDDIGLTQEALYTLLNTIDTNVDAVNAKLDSDTGVADTNYAALYNLTALSSQGKGLAKNGMYQTDLYAQLSEMETDFNAILTKLDSDTGVSDSDYNSTYAVDLNDRASANGLGQDDIVSFLDDFVDNFNDTLTKLDADA